MLVLAPWFVHALPPVNARYTDDVIDPCFEAVTYTVGGKSIRADVEYVRSDEGAVYRCVTKAYFSNFSREGGVVELTLVTKDAGFYHELPVPSREYKSLPAAEGTPAFMLMTAYEDAGGWHYWGSTREHPNAVLELCAPLLVEACQQLAAKLTPQRPS